MGFTGQSACPGGNGFHLQFLILVFSALFSGAERHNEPRAEPLLEEPAHDHFHMATILGGFCLNVQFSKNVKSGFELG